MVVFPSPSLPPCVCISSAADVQLTEDNVWKQFILVVICAFVLKEELLRSPEIQTCASDLFGSESFYLEFSIIVILQQYSLSCKSETQYCNNLTSVYKQLDTRKHLNGGRRVLVLVFIFHPERMKPPWVSWFVRSCHFFPLQVSITSAYKMGLFWRILKLTMYSCVTKVKNCTAGYEDDKD